MKRELKALLARLERTPDTSCAPSGSPVDLVLRPAESLGRVKTISGIEVLTAHGLSLLKAKRTIEAMVEDGEAIVHVPAVEDIRGLARAFRAAGIAASAADSNVV